VRPKLPTDEIGAINRDKWLSETTQILQAKRRII
jgi:hypothetical protein